MDDMITFAFPVDESVTFIGYDDSSKSYYFTSTFTPIPDNSSTGIVYYNNGLVIGCGNHDQGEYKDILLKAVQIGKEDDESVVKIALKGEKGNIQNVKRTAEKCGVRVS